MASSRRIIGFINAAHALDHMVMLVFPTAILGMQAEFDRSYGELLALALGGFIAFGAGSLPAGWLGDRWSRRNMMALFFLGVGAACCLTGLARSTAELAVGLTAIGLFAAIYHPVGTAMLVSHADKVGTAIGKNGVWGNLGVASAALIAGAVTQWLGWRWAFFLPGSAAIGIGVAYLLTVPDMPNQARSAGAAVTGRFPRAILVQAFAVLGLVTLAGGVVFNAVTVALPKLFDETLPQVTGSSFAVGLLASLVFVIGAMAQLVVGRVVDRHPLKSAFLPLAACLVPLLLIASYARGWLVVPVATCVIFVVFGQVTINDAMVARYATAEWRARVYAIRYLFSFGVSATAVPLVAFTHDHGGFGTFFTVLFGFSLFVLLGALLFPYRRDEIAPAVSAGAA